jgi:hypothetical protein
VVRYNEIMVILGMLSWWYGTGWKLRLLRLREKVAATVDYFSIDLLLRTLFSPFRQISAGRVDGPLNIKMRAFFDRLISRMIGAMVRTFMIVVGTIAIIMHMLIGGTTLLAWAFVPLAPLIGLALFMSGWMPWIS